MAIKNMTMHIKSPTRTAVLFFIVKYKREHDGNSPTIREIMDDCKISSTSMVFWYLNQLENLGYIRRPEPKIGNRIAAKIEVVGGKWIYIGGEREHS
jgi:SOS-response transcriptional repressor LexA